MSVPLSRFYPYVLPQVPGASRPLVRQKLLQAADRFCQDTNVVQLAIDPVDVVANQMEYDLDAVPEQVLSRVLRVWYRNNELESVAPDFIDNPFAFRPAIVAGDIPTATEPSVYYQLSPNANSITVWPKPTVSVAKALTIRAAYRPARNARNLDDVLYNNWLEGIVAGTLYMLHEIPQQSFTSQERAAFHMAVFYREIARARIQARLGNARTGVRVRFTPFA